MGRATSNFPISVWDGSSQSRPNTDQSPAILEYRKPDADDWNQAVAEIVAIQNLIAGSTIPAVPQIFTFVVSGAANVGTDVTEYHAITTSVFKLIHWDIYAATPPAGGNLVFDILFSTDNGSTWTSFWSSQPKPTLNDGQNQNGGSDFDVFEVGGLAILRLDVISVGGDVPGGSVTVQLSGAVPFPPFFIIGVE